MIKIINILIVLSLLFNITGCEAIRKKFTRKKKEAVKMPRIYQVRKYEKKPTPELYKKHYAFWMSWNSELIKVLGKNHKKDKVCIENIISNLKDMQNILIKEKGDELAVHIAKLEKARDIIYRENLNMGNRVYVLQTLQREERFIRREFYYTKVKDKLRTSFDEEPGQED